MQGADNIQDAEKCTLLYKKPNGNTIFFLPCSPKPHLCLKSALKTAPFFYRIQERAIRKNNLSHPRENTQSVSPGLLVAFSERLDDWTLSQIFDCEGIVAWKSQWSGFEITQDWNWNYESPLGCRTEKTEFLLWLSFCKFERINNTAAEVIKSTQQMKCGIIWVTLKKLHGWYIRKGLIWDRPDCAMDADGFIYSSGT